MRPLSLGAAAVCAYFQPMPEFLFTLADIDATKNLGAAIARRLKAGDVVGLVGPLGAGKTTLARSVIETLCGKIEAPSPTFSLVESYEAGAFTLWHFDLYRLEKAEDVWELGLEDALAGVCLIEWPDRAAAVLPPDMLLIDLSLDGRERRAVIRSSGEWSRRLEGLNAR